MAKLNREETLRALFAKHGWCVEGRPIPQWIDSDFAIDAFGKLAKNGVTQDMLDYIIEHNLLEKSFSMLGGNDWCDATIEDPSSLDWAKALTPSHIKKVAKDGGYKAKIAKPSAKPSAKGDEGKPFAQSVEVAPIELSGDAIMGALGKSIGKALVDDYGKLIAEATQPQIRKFIEDEYGVVEKRVKFVVPDRGEIEEVTHEVFEEVLTYVQGNDPVMLVGEAGTGKNVICEQIAKVLDIPFYFTNKVSDEYQLKGYMDAKGEFQPTPLYVAMKNGGVFMLDEMDASDETALEVLHSVLANKYLTFPNGEFVRSHEDFRVLAGCNTFGTGATYQYVGRRQLDGATLNRFMTVKVDYSPRIEDTLTDDKELLSFYRKFRNSCKEYGINHIVSYRNLIQLDKYGDALGIIKALKSALLKNLEKDDLSMLARKFECDSDRWAKGLMDIINA